MPSSRALIVDRDKTFAQRLDRCLGSLGFTVEIAENRYLDKREVPQTTFTEMAAKYLDWSKVNKRSSERDDTSLKALRTVFDRQRLVDITREGIERYKTVRSEVVSKAFPL